MVPLLIDENLNHRIVRGVLRLVPNLNYRLIPAVGLKGAPDSVVLEAAAKENRVLVTHDLRTIPKHAYERLKAGILMTGVVAIPDDLPIRLAIQDLALLAECANHEDIRGRVIYLPL